MLRARTIGAAVCGSLVFGLCSIVTAGILVTGSDVGTQGHVKAFTLPDTVETASFFAYGPGATGGARVAIGDINGDGIPDIITGAGPGAGPHVRVFDGSTGAEIRSFFAYSAAASDGVYVAVGDVNGDGYADIITGYGATPHVKVFSGATGAEISSFFAYDTGFTGGVRVAAGDINGDGRADIITGTGPGGTHVKVFNGAGLVELRSFFAYGASGDFGLFVAGADVNGDGVADIIVGPDSGVADHVIVYSGDDSRILHSFFAYGGGFTGGVRVAAGDVNGDGLADIVTGAGPGAASHIKVFDASDLSTLQSFFAYPAGYTGGVYVAAIPEPAVLAPLVAGMILLHRRQGGGSRKR